jgi:plastocyanin
VVTRLTRKAVLLGVLIVVVSQTPAFAATYNVTITDPVVQPAFDPPNLVVAIGDSVLWTNIGNAVHNTQETAVSNLWNSPPMSAGQSFTFRFTAAGTYPYHCRFHPGLMKGTVAVPDVASPTSGPAGTIFTITVAAGPGGGQFVYDVQMRSFGSPWQDWMLGVTQASVQWDSTGKAAGHYQFRSRLHRISDNTVSGYSPQATVTVT